MVDRPMVLRKLSELDSYMNQIREYGAVSPAEYRSDWKVQRIVERTLQMMIETCSDVANHIISDKGLRAPTGYADTFRVLHENRIITDELLPVMEKMAKFRNVIVHQYESVDAGIVILILKKHLSDFETFKEAVLKDIR